MYIFLYKEMIRRVLFNIVLESLNCKDRSLDTSAEKSKENDPALKALCAVQLSILRCVLLYT